MVTVPTLDTERFVLRELVRADVAALFPTFADEAAMRWWSRGPFVSKEKLAGDLVPDEGWNGRSWAVTEREGGAVVGRVVAMDRGDAIAEIGYIVVKHRQGEGIAREALAALIEQLFGAEGVRRIYADVDPENAASNRLVERLGFTLEGRLREQWTTHIGARDSLIWGLLASEWSGGGLMKG
jgi:RimJ/RimL family protein N-acetyltransferase